MIPTLNLKKKLYSPWLPGAANIIQNIAKQLQISVLKLISIIVKKRVGGRLSFLACITTGIWRRSKKILIWWIYFYLIGRFCFICLILFLFMMAGCLMNYISALKMNTCLWNICERLTDQLYSGQSEVDQWKKNGRKTG